MIQQPITETGLAALLFTNLITKLDTQLQQGLSTNSHCILYTLLFTNQIKSLNTWLQQRQCTETYSSL